MKGILVGDIGGTKTTLAVASPKCGARDLSNKKTFQSRKFSSLEAILEEFLNEATPSIGSAVLGIAGPVVEGHVKTTNLPWKLVEANLAKDLGLSSVKFINDVEAMAYGILYLDESELIVLNQGIPSMGGTAAVIAPGTGLGEAFLTWDGTRYNAHASEGGHADFGPKTLLEWELLNFIKEQIGHVSYERVCSGPGIANIYDYLKHGGYGDEPDWLSAQLADAEDATPVIVGAALDDKRSCPICVKALEEFVSILGSEVGNLALKVMATGGIYLGGGIVPRILPFLKKEILIKSFRNKGRYADLMQRIPVSIILSPDVAIFGAAHKALER